MFIQTMFINFLILHMLEYTVFERDETSRLYLVSSLMFAAINKKRNFFLLLGKDFSQK